MSDLFVNGGRSNHKPLHELFLASFLTKCMSAQSFSVVECWLLWGDNDAMFGFGDVGKRGKRRYEYLKSI